MAGQRGDGELIIALATGASHLHAARRAGVSVRTVERRMAEPNFRRRVSEVRGALISVAIGKLSDATGDAAMTLRRLLASPNDNVALGAAKSILELVVKLRDVAEIEDRVRRLEDHNDA